MVQLKGADGYGVERLFHGLLLQFSWKTSLIGNWNGSWQKIWSRAVARDLRVNYGTATLCEAEQSLERFAAMWYASYPTISVAW